MNAQAFSDQPARIAASGQRLAPPPLAADVQSHIGRQLKAVYDKVVDEPVPERFLKLLEELERKMGNP